jgi:serine/threonine protein kinase/Tol biopolymer transport system component
MPLQTGSTLHKRYRIEGILGQGGMGAVYQATDINLGVSVAVKENLFTTEEYARQFHREATILAGLRHPNLPRVTDHFVIEGEGQYLVMDFIQGADLRERLEKGGPITEAKCVPWFLEICDALAYLHSRTPPILHRDIKPGNIKITPEGRAILVDFGLAKFDDQSGATATGAKAMTPGFSPPEQYGTGRTDPRTDVYSLGATLYASLTASIPEDAVERIMGREKLTPIRERNPNINMALARVVTKSLEVKPEERYQTINEMASALSAASAASRPTMIRNYEYLNRTVPLDIEDFEGEESAPSRLEKYKNLPRRILLGGLALVAGAMLIFTASKVIPALLDIAAGSAPGEVSTANVPLETGDLETTPSDAAGVVGVPTDAGPTPADATGGPAASEPTPTPMGGGGGQIAFASDQSGIPQIYLMNIDGEGAKALTSLDEGACQPAWAPDGMRLIFTSPCPSNQKLYPGSSLWLMDVSATGEVTQPRPLRSVPGGDFDPAWSPDGQTISFTSVRDNRPQIYSMKLDGSDLNNLSGDLAKDRESDWSPAGSQLVFTSTRGGEVDIWMMPDTGEADLRFSRDPDREETSPAWSNNGQLILFTRQVGGISRLIMAPFDQMGVQNQVICPSGERAVQPMAEADWSPDDEWIVFETWPDGVNHNLAIMTANCIQYTLLTDGPSTEFDAAWRLGW